MTRKLIALLALITMLQLSPRPIRAADVRESPAYKGKGLPTPPQQHAPWVRPPAQLPKALLDDVDLLFAQGVADPRGGDYREIEVGTGSCWNGDGGIVKTHGWVLSVIEGNQQFAVCWNGLVYPVVSVGEKANLSADVDALCQKKAANAHGATPEAAAIAIDSPLSLKVCLLLRLGNVDLAERLWPLVNQQVMPDQNGQQQGVGQGVKQPDDPYLGLATEWCWYAFDRAVCAHMWGNDVVSRDTAQLLTDALPKIEATASKLGYKRPVSFETQKPGPYIGFVDRLAELLADQQRRVKETNLPRVLDDPKRFPDKTQRIAALIRDLEIVSARQTGQPGGVGLDDDPIPEALEKEGLDAVEPLINCLEKDDRLTRSVSFGRDFFQARHLLTVKGAAYAVLQHILQTETFGPATDQFNRGGTGNAKAIAAEIRVYWSKSKGTTPAQRWLDTLADDSAGPARWVEAAGFIVEPGDVERRGQWIVTPSRNPGHVPYMKGESLRSKRNPSVADLMAKRVPAVAAENDGWLFAQSNAARLALYLHKWDGAAAVPALREQMKRCIAASDNDRKRIPPDPRFAQSTQTTEQMAREIGQMTTALAESHDSEGIRLYCKWVVEQTPATPGSHVGELLRPIWRFPDDPNLAAAADALFNGPASAFRCLGGGAHFRDWGPTRLMSSAIYGVPSFRRHLARNLDDVTEVGTAQVKDHSLAVEIKDGPGGGFGGVNVKDPLLPKPADTKVPVRVCDWYAWQISKLDGAPAFELYWPVAKRDEKRQELTNFLNRWGDRFRYSPLQDTLGFGFPNQDSGRMTFPLLDHPATDADVASTNAIFSLHGEQVRTVKLPKWPAKAKWSTFKGYPVQQQGATDEKGVTAYYDDYLNQGLIWQAEEVQVNGKWERFYGFVGPHVIAKVPGDQIEFEKDQ